MTSSSSATRTGAVRGQLVLERRASGGSSAYLARRYLASRALSAARASFRYGKQHNHLSDYLIVS
jgi:hypothetical protein